MAKTGVIERTLEAQSPGVTPGVGTKLYYETTREGTTVSYKIGITTFVKSSGGYYNNRIACQVNVNGSTGGVNRTVKGQTSGSIYGNTYWVKWDANGNTDYWINPSENKYAFTGTTTVSNASATTMTVTVLYKATGYGYSENNPGEWSWNNPTATWSTQTFTLDIDKGIVPPTITSATVVSNSVGTASYSGQATKGTGGLEPEFYVWSGLGNSTAGGLAGTVGNLTHNGTYNWTLTVTADDGGRDTASGTVYIKHNAPTLSNYSYSGVRNGNYYTGTITYQVGYDQVGYDSHSLSYGTTTSYGSSGISQSTGAQPSWTLNNLLPNTTYHYRVVETDNGHIPETTTSSDLTFTTDGNNPIINSVNLNYDQTSCTFSFPSGGITWDNTSAASGNYVTLWVKLRGTSNWGSPITGRDTVTVTGLTSYTQYDYWIQVTDKQGRSGYKTDYFRTKAIDFNYQSLDVTLATNTSISVRAEFISDPTLPITAHIELNGTSYATVSNVSSPFTYTFNNLNPDTYYPIEVWFSESPGGSYSKTTSGTTTLPAPTLTTSDVVIIDPFTVQGIIQVSIVPSRTIQYRFSKDGGSTWTNYQSSSIYTWTNLEPETEYSIIMEAKAVHTASGGQDSSLQVSYTITTPADQASVAIKKSTGWQYGKTWFRRNGEWLKAKKVYIKKNGSWVVNKNFK